MTTPLRFDDLRAVLQQRVAQLPDCRKGRNTQYHMPDAALGAFGIFFTQSPSFLEYQRRLQANKGHNNVHTLFGVTKIPCDNHIRTLLDPNPPRSDRPELLRLGLCYGLRAPCTAPSVRQFPGLRGATLGGAGWHKLLFLPSHPVSQLSHASALDRAHAVLSLGHHPGGAMPRTLTGHRLTSRVHHAPRWS